MSTVVTFIDYTPVSRTDGVPWTSAQIEEAATNSDDDNDWTLIDTITLVPDVDPEFPTARSFTTILGTDSDMWYRVRFFDANGDNSAYTEPVQNIAEDFFTTPYAGTAELARILKLRSPSAEQLLAMERVLETSSLEIDSELDRNGAFGTPYPALVVQVCLERSVEHWQQQESAFGIIGLGGVDGLSVRAARDSWDRHAHKLAPLKDAWGLA